MKVFIAKVYGWAHYEILGVFSSEEAAQERVNSLFASLKNPDEVDIVGKVQSFELDKIFPSYYENGTY